MKLLFASDSFKGSLSSARTAELLTQAARSVWPDAECISLPMADGGEGTADTVLSAVGGRWIETDAHDALSRPVRTKYVALNEESCFIEMALVNGVTMLDRTELDPMLATTYGTGELIKDALNRGFRTIYVSIGGSATNDGGIGCLRALGAGVFDMMGNSLLGTGRDLCSLSNIELSTLDSRLKDCRMVVLCDVKNPLCGAQGATHVYAAQKGASDNEIALLEAGMIRYKRLLEKLTSIDADEIEGTGAAGGLGAALLLALKAKKCSGIETILQMTNFDECLHGVDLVITGEGCLDHQSCNGKVVQGVGKHCKHAGVDAYAIVGRTAEGADEILKHGIKEYITTSPEAMPIEEAMRRADELYLIAAKDLFYRLKNETNQ